MSFEVKLPFFDAQRIAESGQCFRWHKAGEGEWLIPAHGRVLHLREMGEDVLRLDCSLQEWETLWRPYFDADTDYEAVAASIDEKDEYLLKACRAARGVRVLRQPLFEVVISFIISQNNNIPRIAKSISALCGGQDAPFPSAEAVAAMDEERLRGFGVGYRAPYIQKAARKFLQDGTEHMQFSSYGDAKVYFESFTGIGPKVADCVCLFGLGKKDAFPMDTWMKRIVARHYDGIFPIGRYPGTAGILQQWMFFYERLGENQP